jgi:ubiquinone/menaquinone biosynthesis C-methylase UbiE
MTDSDTIFAGSVPEIYDLCLVPAMFEPYALDLAARVAGREQRAVLETACGTGVLTRELRQRLPRAVALVATDLNQPMLTRARALVDTTRRIEFRQADCTALPFPKLSFTAVACQFGMMFAPNKPQAVREARRVLVEGGLFAFNVWDSLENNGYARVAHETIGEFFPTDPPRFFADTPYRYFDREFWSEHLLSEGFAEARVEVVARAIRSPTALELATGLIRGTPVSNAIQQRGGDMDRIVERTALGLANLGGDQPFQSTMRALVVTALAQ